MVAERQNSSTYFAPLYSIGKAAKILGISVHTLRMYEREGLILLRKSESSQRRLSEWDLERIRCVRRAISEEKYSIASIRRMLSFLPCWKVKGCPDSSRTTCPAYGAHRSPCWALAQKPEPCAHADCHECPVYVKFADCVSIQRMLFQLVDPTMRVSP